MRVVSLESRKADQIEKFLGRAFSFLGIVIPSFQTENNIFKTGAPGQERCALKDKAHHEFVVDFMRGPAVDENFSARMRHETVDDPQQT